MPPAAPPSLPLPAVAFAPPCHTSRIQRIWTRLKREMGPGSIALDSLPWSESLDSGSSLSGGGGPWTPGSSSHGGGGGGGPPGKRDGGDGDGDDGPVDQIVVDNLAPPHRWLDLAARSSSDPDRGSHSGGSQCGPDDPPKGQKTASERSASVHEYVGSTEWLPVKRVGAFVKCQIWPGIRDFIAARYPDKDTEQAFQRELWYSQKSTHVAGAVFMLFNYLLQIGLQQGVTTFNRAAIYVIGPTLSTILIVMAIFNAPKRRKWAWQLLTWVLCWIGSCGFLIDLSLCGYYDRDLSDRHCTSRDFLPGLFYACVYPTTALFALGQRRICVIIGMLIWIVIACVLIVPAYVNFLRDMLPWGVFLVFMLFFHYMRENSDRRTYSLRMEVKVQYRAKQRAQINERSTMEAKRRFSNYIFHEVRVPLNTALLAIQNLKSSDPALFDPSAPSALEYTALQSSLSMMSTVLNDVLDFTKMSRGGFSSVCKPFSFHRVIRSILAPLQLDAVARGLALSESLDLDIDRAAVAAMKLPQKEGGVDIGDGVLMGDETRIRQVINNLASNACKFTNPGGQIRVVTKLIYPAAARTATLSSTHQTGSDATVIGMENIEMGNLEKGDMGGRSLVVRVEVHDTGVGIHKKDTEDGKMFSAYHQNYQTMQQGGKGTGLGLSLAKQIVSLSGGRLGVQSRVGEGSCFWFELPLGTISPETAEADIEFARKHSALKVDLATPYSEGHSDYGFTVSSPSVTAPPTPALATSPASTLPTPPPEGPRELRESALEKPPIPTVALPTPPTPPISDPSPPALAKNIATNFSNGPLRALSVDDDPLTRKLMSRMLSRLGCEVSTAENGAIALDMILNPSVDGEKGRTCPFDVIFLDNQMPVMTGIQVAARLKSIGRDDICIGVTANADLHDQDEFKDAGATLILTKPVREADIRHVLVAVDRKRGANHPPVRETPSLAPTSLASTT